MKVPVTPTPIQKIDDPLYQQKKVEVYIKRDDLTDQEIMGNKWRKLKYNLKKAKDENYRCIASYGGAYSNHIAALAAAGKIFGIETIGIIRGDELKEDSNPTLRKASRDGMKLYFTSRSDFNSLKEALKLPFSPEKKTLVLPEGGTNELAIKGCSEIMDEVDQNQFDLICTAVGTGGTLAGLASKMLPDKELWGFYALKGNWIEKHTADLFSKYSIPTPKYRVFQESNFGGYGKINEELIQFILDFRQKNRILLDPVYTGKLLFSVGYMIKNDQIAVGRRLLLLHTGGLQGLEGIRSRYQLALPTL